MSGVNVRQVIQETFGTTKEVLSVAQELTELLSRLPPEQVVERQVLKNQIERLLVVGGRLNVVGNANVTALTSASRG